MKTLRLFIVMIGAMGLAALSINAFDNFDHPSRSLLGAAYSAVAHSSVCPQGMVFVGTSARSLCVDVYEASAGTDCPHNDPRSSVETDENLALSTCGASSQETATPWRNITKNQAELACARAGKRLLTNSEWYHAALGTPDTFDDADSCNLKSTASAPDVAGAHAKCVSPLGIHDMLGNVWEWTGETVDNGLYQNHQMPTEGYVTSIDDSGVPLTTSSDTPSATYFNDYLWTDPTEVRGMLRGGYWRSGQEGGQYTVNASVLPLFSGDAVGFRCARDVERQD